MKHLRKVIPLLLLLLLVNGVVLAQGIPTIGRWIIGGGGGTATGGNVSLSSALGEAIAGHSSGGNVSISAGFWTGGAITYIVYLPAVTRNLIVYAPPCGPGNNYCEDYDTKENAYGPLEPGTSYSAYPDDSSDYYYVILTNPASVTAQVTDYQAEGQLIVYDKDYNTLGRDYNPLNGDGIMTVGPLDLKAGKYYIRVYTGHTNATSLYALTVTY